jgi:Predicted nucleotide-binding protein containing TIR-like domain
MKPRIFIGSSVESLNLAYAIQENLEYDATTTVWTQGIFELSATTIESLIKALESFDFGVFVFSPDDISQIRNEKLNTVRDNVIFEFGLFIGKLGRNKVFFVIPGNISDFHLPTDLSGITPGKYDNKREDKNLKAALGPFCNQVRGELKKFTYENLIDLANENDIVKKIAIEKPEFWEYFLSSELLKSRLKEINSSYLELEKGLVFQKNRSLEFEEYLKWARNLWNDIIRLMEIMEKLFMVELINSYGEPGEAGSVIEIKSVVDRITSICKEFLAWEYDVQGVVAPEEFKEVAEIMKGWTKPLFDEINKFPELIEQSFNPENLAKNNEVKIKLKFDAPPNVERISEILKSYV